MSIDENSERDLIRQIVHGKRIAMKRFYDDYSGYLTAVCARYISNEEDVKDVLQESFLKIFKAIHRFEYRGEGSLRAWSTRIVVNESLRHLKANEKMQFTTLAEDDLPNPADDQEPDIEERYTHPGHSGDDPCASTRLPYCLQPLCIRGEKSQRDCFHTAHSRKQFRFTIAQSQGYTGERDRVVPVKKKVL